MRISDWSSDVCSSDLGTRWSDTTETGGGERRGIAEIAAAERAPVGIAADRAIGDDVAARFAIARDEHEAAAIELLAEGAAEFVIGQITAARNTVAALEQQPVIVAPHDHVDHARNRVRAVDRRGAVLEHLDRKSTRLNSSH